MFSKAFHSSPTAQAITRVRDGLFIDANDSLCQLLGYSREELIGRTTVEVGIYQDGEERQVFLQRFSDQADSRNIEKVIKNRLGELLTGLVSIEPVTVGGEDCRLVTIIDITARKRHEANMAFLADIGDDFARLSGTREIMQAVGEKMYRHYNLSRLAFSYVNEPAGFLTGVYDQHAPGLPSALGDLPISAMIDENHQRDFKAGRVVVVNERDGRPPGARAADDDSASGVSAQLLAPFVSGGVFRFLITLQKCEPYQWRADQVELLQEIAPRIYYCLERAHAEQAQRESQQYIANLVNTSFEGIWSVDASGKTTFVNQRAADILGYTLEEIVGHNAMEFLMPSDVEAGRQTLARVAAGESGRVEAYARHKNGHEVWLLVAFSPILDAGGQFQGALAMFNDITERVYTEAALRSAATRDAYRLQLSDALRSLSDPLEMKHNAARVLGEHLQAGRVLYADISDDQTKVIVQVDYCRDDLPSMVGQYRFNDINGLVKETIRAGHSLVAADVSQLSELSASEQAAYAGLHMHALVIVSLVRDGRLRAGLAVSQDEPRAWTEDEVALVEETAERTWDAVERARAEGELRVSEATLRVSEATLRASEATLRESEATLRASEQRFRSSIESLNEAFVIVSSVRENGQIVDFRYEYVNEQCCQMLHRTREQITGRTILGLLPEHQETGLFEKYVQVVETGQPIEEQASFLISPGDSQPQQPGIYYIRASKFGDGLIVTANDVTDQLRMEAEHHEAVKQHEIHHRLARQRESERQRYARDIHDGPIQSLSGLAFTLQYLKEIYPDPALKRELEDAAASVKGTIQELRELINELRPPSVIRFGVAKAIQSHSSYLRERYPQITWSLALDEDEGQLPEQTCLALFRIYQEAVNNIVNHSKASQAWVYYQVLPDELVLEIVDNGVGFEDRVDVAALTSQQHFGLAGISERVEAIKGSVSITSQPGRGTTVKVQVPV